MLKTGADLLIQSALLKWSAMKMMDAHSGDTPAGGVEGNLQSRKEAECCQKQRRQADGIKGGCSLEQAGVLGVAVGENLHDRTDDADQTEDGEVDPAGCAVETVACANDNGGD